MSRSTPSAHSRAGFGRLALQGPTSPMSRRARRKAPKGLHFANAATYRGRSSKSPKHARLYRGPRYLDLRPERRSALRAIRLAFPFVVLAVSSVAPPALAAQPALAATPPGSPYAQTSPTAALAALPARPAAWGPSEAFSYTGPGRLALPSLLSAQAETATPTGQDLPASVLAELLAPPHKAPPPAGGRTADLTKAGSVAAFGTASYLGEPAQRGPYLVSVAASPAGPGYWAATSDGDVFAYGTAHLYGSLAGRAPAGGIAAMAATPDGDGYWLVSRDGDVFTFGDAGFYGSLGNRSLPAPVVGLATTADGKGYWLATASGGVYSFGDARYFGSLGGSQLLAPVVGIAAAPGGTGYWLATSDGGVFSYGRAKFFGSMAHSRVDVSAIASTAHAQGYWLLTASGTVHGFGAAHYFGRAYAAPADRSAKAKQHSASTPARRASAAKVDEPSASSSGRSKPTSSGRLPVPGGASGASVASGAKRSVGSGKADTQDHAASIAPVPGGKGYIVASSDEPAPSLPGAAAARDQAGREASGNDSTSDLNFLGTFIVTCYDLTGVTASGALAGPDSVAVDPGVIPLGTRLYIDGVGERVADDTGGAIVGEHVDIWEPTFSACANWGVQEEGVYRVG